MNHWVQKRQSQVFWESVRKFHVETLIFILGRGSANSRSSNRSQKTQTTPKKASKNSSKSRLSAEEHQRRENLVAAIEICERAIEATRNHKLKAQSLIDLARNWLRLRLELGRLNNEVIQPNNLKIGASAIKNELPLVFVWLSLDLYYFGHSRLLKYNWKLYFFSKSIHIFYRYRSHFFS